MKRLFIVLTFIGLNVYSQLPPFEILMENGKAEFKKEFDKQDYSIAADNLEKAVKLQPKNAEAHYFLGYAYSRLNSKDGKSMIQEKLSSTIKASEQFEIVNKLQSKYTGEIVILDPYSKLTAEWGSLAMSYWHNNKPDSSIWAFREGKKRGGFGNFYLSINKAVLDLCSKNSILISSGDNFTIPLWYLQIVEGYRKDVSVIDISLLNTTWYPAFLENKGIVRFDLPKTVMDTIDYSYWSDSTITINNFSWTVKPTYSEHYIMRGDRIFLSLLKENNFKRDVYFTTAFNENYRLSLASYLLPLILADKLNSNNQQELNYNPYNLEITKILLLIKTVNPNSQQEVSFIDNIRYDILNYITKAINSNNKKEAKELLNLMNKYANEKTFPYQNQDGKKYADYIRGQL